MLIAEGAKRYAPAFVVASATPIAQVALLRFQAWEVAMLSICSISLFGGSWSWFLASKSKWHWAKNLALATGLLVLLMTVQTAIERALAPNDTLTEAVVMLYVLAVIAMGAYLVGLTGTAALAKVLKVSAGEPVAQ